ncbi:MAG: hypothetical protein U9Q12_00910 [Patescibacteria group bacterium]|nr:hypothetical protein [Patescibacteria group bacterium]
MKKNILGIGIILVLAMFSGCGGGEGVSDYDVTIPDVITAEATKDADATLGNLEKNKVVVVVKKGAFEDNQKVQIQTPENIPTQENAMLLGSPLEISVEDKESVRFDEPTVITMAFDKSKIPEDADESFLRVGYHNGEQWEYIKPDSIDMDASTMTFKTYHFSTYSPSISEKTKITEQFLHSQALDNVIRDNVNNESDYVTQQIIAMTLAKMGITDAETQQKIFDKVADAEEYKEIYDLYQKGDTEGAAQKTALLAGKKIASNVPDSVWKEALGGVVGAADDIAKVSEAAGYAAEGQYKEAAKIIGEQIADKFLITTAGKIAAQVVAGQIDSWKNSEVDAAYGAYKNGADGYFWGYNVDKGDFEGIWNQMRGIGRQLELEAVAKENEIRKEAGMPELSEREIALVHVRVKQAYKKQFEQRSEKEDIIKKEEEKLKMMFDAFEEANVFTSGLGPQTLNKKGYTYEQKLELMHHFGKKMMDDTQRTELTDGAVGLSDKKISTAQIIIAAKKYFSEPDGKKKYEEYIKEEFGVGMYPAIEDLKGDSIGGVTVTDIKITDEFRQKLENGEGPEGCDLAALEELKGKENPMKLTFNPTSATGGQVTMNDGDSMPFSYYDGKIEITIIDDENDMDGKIFIDATKKEDGTIVLDGKMHVDYMGGDISIKGDVNVQK